MRFLPSSGGVNTSVWMHHIKADKTHRKKARLELHKKTPSYSKQ